MFTDICERSKKAGKFWRMVFSWFYFLHLQNSNADKNVSTRRHEGWGDTYGGRLGADGRHPAEAGHGKTEIEEGEKEKGYQKTCNCFRFLILIYIHWKQR